MRRALNWLIINDTKVANVLSVLNADTLQFSMLAIYLQLHENYEIAYDWSARILRKLHATKASNRYQGTRILRNELLLQLLVSEVERIFLNA